MRSVKQQMQIIAARESHQRKSQVRGKHTTTKPCVVCGNLVTREWKRRNRNFTCTLICHRALLSKRTSPMKGRAHSSEFKANMSARLLGKKQTPDHVAARTMTLRDGRLKAGWTKERRLAQAIRCNHQPRRSSSLEHAVASVLKTLDIQYEAQKRIGQYSVDFYLPDRNLIIECDGEYWHQDKSRDDLRDANLRDFGYYIVHIPGKAIKTDTRAALEAAWSLTPHDTFDGEKE